MELWQLVARESARDLVARYNACGDADRLDEMVDLFAADAVMDVGEWGRHEGRSAIQAFFEGVRRPPADDEGTAPAKRDRMIRHFTATHMIDVDDEESARGRCYFLVVSADGLDHWGRYLDSYVKREGRWLFGRREVVVDGIIEGGWAASRRAH